MLCKLSRTFSKRYSAIAAAKRIGEQQCATEKGTSAVQMFRCRRERQRRCFFCSFRTYSFRKYLFVGYQECWKERHSGQKGTAGMPEQIPERLYRKRYRVSIIGSPFNTKTKQVQIEREQTLRSFSRGTYHERFSRRKKASGFPAGSLPPQL